jgi:hypothetical protein
MIWLRKALIWRGGENGGIIRNFEFKAQARVFGDGLDSNSGIYYRASVAESEGPYILGGYQCDVHPRPWFNGHLYHERNPRGSLAFNGQRIIVTNDGLIMWVGSSRIGARVAPVNLEEWHQYHVYAYGNRMIHRVNGDIVADVIDHQINQRVFEGLLALQIHVGVPMKVEYRDIQLRLLPDGGILNTTDAPLPSEAINVSIIPLVGGESGR